MAERYATKSGNWDDPTVWDGGTLPGVGDDVYANGFTVSVNVDVTVASIRTTAGTTAVAGGLFDATAAVTVTSNVIAGTTTCLRNNTVLTVAVVGDVTGGSGLSCYGVYNTSTGTISIDGNVTGGSGSSCWGVYNTSTGTISIVGDVTGGSGSSCWGVYNISAGTISIVGDVTGGSGLSCYGVYNTSVGTISIDGIVAPSNYLYGDLNANVGVLNNNAAGKIFIGGLRFGPAGNPPVGGTAGIFIKTDAPTKSAAAYDNPNGNLELFSYTDDPDESDVRDGVVYDFANKTGALVVPDPAYVALGVPVDNTVGTLQFAAPTGANAVTITTAPGARVSVQVGGVDYWMYDADGTGLITAYLDAGTYDFIGTLTGYVITPSIARVISGDAAFTLAFAPISLPSSADPALCACYLDLREAFSNDIPAALPTDSRVRIRSNPAGTTADYSNAWTAIAADDFSAGRITLELPRLSTVEFCIPGYVSKTVITIPDAASANISGVFP